MERERAILRYAHEREMCRLQGRNGILQVRAQNRLWSGVAAARKSAARILGRLRFIYSYEPLVQALARECKSGDEGSAVKAAMLKSLDKIGSEHCGQKTLTTGREPLNEFIMAHLDDHVLVRAALKALRWTGSFDDTIQDTRSIEEAARAAGYEKSAGVASKIYLGRIEAGAELTRAEAEVLLRSAVAAERKRAANNLGRLHDLRSYQPLLNALAQESGPAFGNREVKAAILEALESIGGEHAGQAALGAGREPLKRFSMAHLDDAGLVRAALEASGWTVSITGDAIHDLDEVKEAARSAAAKGGPDAEKYRATATEATDIYFDWIRSR